MNGAGGRADRSDSGTGCGRTGAARPRRLASLGDLRAILETLGHRPALWGSGLGQVAFAHSVTSLARGYSARLRVPYAASLGPREKGQPKD